VLQECPLLKQSDPLDIMVLAAGVLQECPLLKKMPSLKKTGDEQADQEQSLQRAALIEVIDNLWFHPEDALACSMEFIDKKGSRILHRPTGD
jgi:hypothetical protein